MAESVKSLSHLTLSEAQKTGQIERFIEQQERLGTPSIFAAEFSDAVRTLLTKPKSPDQTSD